MLIKRILLPFVATFIGFAISPSYAGDIISCDSFENCADGSVPLTNAILELEARMEALEAENNKLKALLAGVTREIDGNTNKDTLRFSNINVQIVNGSNTTDGTPTGTGNLIIGYNETGNPNGDERTGSHMLVIGLGNNYSAFGGMVVGNQNTTSGNYSSVSGGSGNIASGVEASVSGGINNIASGDESSVSGGYSNTASGGHASVSGGNHNTARGGWSSVSGGYSNTANSMQSSVSGGINNIASGYWSSVSGGKSRTAAGDYFWVAGALIQTQ